MFSTIQNTIKHYLLLHYWLKIRKFQKEILEAIATILLKVINVEKGPRLDVQPLKKKKKRGYEKSYQKNYNDLWLIEIWETHSETVLRQAH